MTNQLSLKRLDEQAGSSTPAPQDDAFVETFRRELAKLATADAVDRLPQIHGRVHTAGRRAADADDSDNLHSGRAVIGDLLADASRESGVARPCIPREEARQGSTKSVRKRSSRTIEAERLTLENATPGKLFGTGHLADPDTVTLVTVDDLVDGPGSRRAAKVTHVLIEEAVREKDDPAATTVGKPTDELVDPCIAR